MCSVEGCSNKAVARGWCQKHYQQQRRAGNSEIRDTPRGSLAERFVAKVDMSGGEKACWPWTGAKSAKGYGFIQEAGRGSRNLLAHRFAYEMRNGPIPAGLVVMHSCDNPSCVNPDHLSAGSQSQNIIDAFTKGRKFSPVPSGERNKRSKLTLEQAKFIKANQQMKHTELAKMFNLSPNCIRSVRIGRTWRDA